ncbi:hypothetical protein DFH07DRAFT_819298 [Mycena maculata]|uniref:Uncharacterized protein n=1 Tax=Mycena maculata TaxID=230809 RepID=A0AAD7J662_9AGAR|nr:hypothetical protein DFH07DRAFT_819298 [Mycena maculata]
MSVCDPGATRRRCVSGAVPCPCPCSPPFSPSCASSPSASNPVQTRAAHTSFAPSSEPPCPFESPRASPSRYAIVTLPADAHAGHRSSPPASCSLFSVGLSAGVAGVLDSPGGEVKVGAGTGEEGDGEDVYRKGDAGRGKGSGRCGDAADADADLARSGVEVDIDVVCVARDIDIEVGIEGGVVVRCVCLCTAIEIGVASSVEFESPTEVLLREREASTARTPRASATT